MDEITELAASVPSPPQSAEPDDVADWLTSYFRRLYSVALTAALYALPPHLRYRAEEVAQEALVDLFIALCRGKEILNPEAFTATVARRKATSLAKREARQRPTSDEDLEAIVNSGSDGAPSGDDRADDRQLIGEALRRMSPGERQAFTLHYLKGWTVEEIAVFRNTAGGSIKKLLSRARAKARQVFEEGGR